MFQSGIIPHFSAMTPVRMEPTGTLGTLLSNGTFRTNVTNRAASELGPWMLATAMRELRCKRVLHTQNYRIQLDNPNTGDQEARVIWSEQTWRTSLRTQPVG